MDFSRLTLGQLLTSEDITIKRNAMSILKVLQRCDHAIENGKCIYCFKTFAYYSESKKKHTHSWGQTKTNESTGEIYYWCSECDAIKDSDGGIIE